ncbi:MAG: hypothetical protein LBS90_01910 [Oscillospiraceae bacterium]|jgi:hypothetical protein|nr:hypothetical protein [Oscillospiraceae bacterium]
MPNDYKKPPQDPGAPANGSLAAPLLPRRYLDRRVGTIIPRGLVLTRQIMMVVAVGANAFVNMVMNTKPELYASRLNDVAAWVIVALHALLLVYCAAVYSRYYGESKNGSEIRSAKTAQKYAWMPLNLSLLTLGSVAAYVFVFVKYLSSAEENTRHNGIILAAVVFLIENVVVLLIRADTLAIFNSDYWISGVYRVSYDVVTEIRVVSRAVPGLGFNFRAEKKVFFESYDENRTLVGRDMMWEHDFSWLEEQISGKGPKSKSADRIKYTRYGEKATKKKKKK